tara:strand:+ start:1456 stop:1809 length:354 start_codon:yes stop_codon:yes gene_type:complete
MRSKEVQDRNTARAQATLHANPGTEFVICGLSPSQGYASCDYVCEVTGKPVQLGEPVKQIEGYSKELGWFSRVTSLHILSGLRLEMLSNGILVPGCWNAQKLNEWWAARYAEASKGS